MTTWTRHRSQAGTATVLRRPVNRYLAAAVAAVAGAATLVIPLGGAAQTAAAMPTAIVLASDAQSATTGISPDEQFMVFLDGSDMKSYEFATGNTVVLSPSAADSYELRISPDSSRATWITGGSSLQRVSAPIAGGPTANLDVGGSFVHFDDATDSLVYSLPGVMATDTEVFAMPIGGGAPTPITTIGDGAAVYRPFLDDPIDGYVITNSSTISAQAGVVAHSLTGGSDVPIAPAGIVWGLVNDIVIYEDEMQDTFARRVPSGSPVPIEDPVGSFVSFADPGTARSHSAATERIAWWDGDDIWIQDLDGSTRWSIETPQVGPNGPNVFATRFSPDGNALAYYDCTTCSGLDGPELRYAEITPGGGALTSIKVPGADDVAFQTAGWKFGGNDFFGEAFLPDGRVLVRQQEDSSATSATFVLWSPTDPASDTITLPWTWQDFTAGIALTPSGSDLLVSGGDGVLRRVSVGAAFGVPEVLEETDDPVVSAHRVGDDIVYNTVPDVSVCPFGNVGSCASDLKLVTDETVAASAVTMLANPGRLMDTRSAGDTEDDIAEAEGALGSPTNNPSGAYRLEVAGRLGIADDASAVALNVTAVNPQGAGFFTVFPCNGPTPTPPLTASLNFGTSSRAVANNVTVGLDVDGDVCIFSDVIADVIVDVAGFFPGTSPLETIVPQRFVDTRPGAVAAQVVAGGIVGVGNTSALTKLEIDVAGIGAVPADAAAVNMNVAAVRPTAQGFATVYPCDLPQPLTSTLNFTVGANVSNGIVIGVAQTTDPATDGKVCVYTNVATELVIDIGGYYPAGEGFVPSSPVRFLETRTSSGAATVDGISQGDGVVQGGTDFTVQVTGRPGVPVGALAVAVNFAAIRPAAESATGFTTSGYLTAYPGPCGTKPLASNLNVSAGETVRANGAVIALPASGEVCVFVSRDVNLLMDVTGYFPG